MVDFIPVNEEKDYRRSIYFWKNITTHYKYIFHMYFCTTISIPLQEHRQWSRFRQDEASSARSFELVRPLQVDGQSSGRATRLKVRSWTKGPPTVVRLLVRILQEHERRTIKKSIFNYKNNF